MELERAKRYHHPLTLVYIDLDNFKAIKMADNLMYEAKNNGKNKIVHKVIAAWLWIESTWNPEYI